MSEIGYYGPNGTATADSLQAIAYAHSMLATAIGDSSIADVDTLLAYDCSPYTFGFDSAPAIAMLYTDVLAHRVDPSSIYMPGLSELL